MIKDKGYVLDDGIISPCYRNMCKMSTLEYIYCKLFVWKSVSRDIKSVFFRMVDSLKEFLVDLFELCLILILPIILYIDAKNTIKEARYEVWKDKCYSCKYYKSSPIIDFYTENITEEYLLNQNICKVCELVDGVPTKFSEG